MAIAEAVVTISFSYLFAAQNFSTHAVMILLLSDLIGLTFYTIITLDFPFSGSVDIVPKKRGSSLFQVGEDETRKNNLELRKKRWSKSVISNLNAELLEERDRQGFHELGRHRHPAGKPGQEAHSLALTPVDTS